VRGHRSSRGRRGGRKSTCSAACARS
jgi:hypothetical protein